MSQKLLKILAVAYFLPLLVGAQSVNLNYALQHELNVEMTPTYPRPNSDVSINLTLYTDDLNSADIIWIQNGKIVLKGKGETSYSFKTGPIGTETKIEIDISLLSGTSFSKILNIAPASVDLVWEANSYTPPFYKGRALHPRQGILKIVAMPEFIKNGTRVSSSNLIYKWSNDVDTYQSQSGYGKNILILNGSILGKTDNIKVSVTDPNSGATAENYISISPTDSEIVFYQNDPYYGYIFDSALNNSFNLGSGEVQILAAPYFFTNEQSGVLNYNWRLNNQTVPELAGSRTAIFKKPEDKSGNSSITLQITNPNRILQEADSRLMIQFK
jgi:hypothetical protein